MRYFYIIYSEAVDKFYIGYTSDLGQRIIEHNSPNGTRWTNGKGPWRLRYYEEFESDTAARKREIEVKRKKRRSYLLWLIDAGPGKSFD